MIDEENYTRPVKVRTPEEIEMIKTKLRNIKGLKGKTLWFDQEGYEGILSDKTN